MPSPQSCRASSGHRRVAKNARQIARACAPPCGNDAREQRADGGDAQADGNSPAIQLVGQSYAYVGHDLELPERQNPDVAEGKPRRGTGECDQRAFGDQLSHQSNRPRLPPIASRIAISRARIGARLVNRPATLAQATSKIATARPIRMKLSAAVGGFSAMR